MHQPRGTSQLTRALHDLVSPAGPDDVYERIVLTAARHVPGATWVSVTVRRNSRYETAAATPVTAGHADRIQYEEGSGPSLDVLVRGAADGPVDLTAGGPWPATGRRLTAELGIRSMLAHPLTSDEGTAGVLSIYSDRFEAFDTVARTMGFVVASYGGTMIAAAANRARADQLEEALRSNREIGIAIGILMSSNRISRREAFQLLVTASQRSNRRLKDIAGEVAVLGALADRHK